MGLKLLVENYRVLRKVEWELPSGVCALAGPNGSGKTTLLEVLEMFRDMLNGGVSEGLLQHGELEGLRNLQANPNDPVVLSITLGSIVWRLQLMPDDPERFPSYQETISEDGASVVDRRSTDPTYDYAGGKINDDKAFYRFAWDRHATSSVNRSLMPPLSILAAYRLYVPIPDLNRLRRKGSGLSGDMVLDEDGQNVLTVLRNWRDRRDTRPRYDFVIEVLQEAFPDIFESLDFLSFKDRVSARIYAPRSRDALSILYAPSGWLTALLHLAAVASTPPGGVVAIDEPENGLHPYAIKRIVEGVKAFADEHELTVLLATHSPVILDQFKDEPQQLLVMEPGRDVLPVPLDEVHDREWLAQFSLGDLYEYGEFGAPAEGAIAGE